MLNITSSRLHHLHIVFVWLKPFLSLFSFLFLTHKYLLYMVDIFPGIFCVSWLVVARKSEVSVRVKENKSIKQIILNKREKVKKNKSLSSTSLHRFETWTQIVNVLRKRELVNIGEFFPEIVPARNVHLFVYEWPNFPLKIYVRSVLCVMYVSAYF